MVVTHAETQLPWAAHQAGLLTTNPGEVAEWSTILPGANSDSQTAGPERSEG